LKKKNGFIDKKRKNFVLHEMKEKYSDNTKYPLKDKDELNIFRPLENERKKSMVGKVF